MGDTVIIPIENKSPENRHRFRGFCFLCKRLGAKTACDEIVVKRFKNECRAESCLKHKNIVAVHEVSTKGDLKYMVMEYVFGTTLKSYLVGNNGPLDVNEILSYIVQVLKALSCAHAEGIIHRDIKPQNIMVMEGGVIKVADFGIAKIPNAETVTMIDHAVGTTHIHPCADSWWCSSHLQSARTYGTFAVIPHNVHNTHQPGTHIFCLRAYNRE